MVSEATLTSLAMLKVHIDESQDYLEYLRPFVIDVLTVLHPDPVRDEDVTQGLLSRFGLAIPRPTVRLLLQRLARSGTLVRDSHMYRISGLLPPTDIDVRKADAARHIDAVVHALLEFDASQARKLGNESEAMDALTAFLSEFSIPCLRAYLRNTTIPDLQGRADWRVTLVSHFVCDLQKRDVSRFNSLTVLVQGHMLANALLCPDLEKAPESYKGVTFYLDTPVLLSLLGLEGIAEALAANEMISLVRQLKGEFACFTHTFDELRHVVEASADYINANNGRGSIVREARRSGRSRSDLLLFAERLEQALAARAIQIVPTPAYTARFQIDESAFADALDDRVSYYNPRAKDADINSVRSIYVLRQGLYPANLERCKAVLVTDNSGFARAASGYGAAFEESREVSSVITAFGLANTAWLKSPQRAPDLPIREVMAFAYAATLPSDQFWAKVLSEADKLAQAGDITERDHQLLRSSPSAQDAAHRLTAGDEDSLDAATIFEALDQVRGEIIAEEAEKRVAAEEALAGARLELQAQHTKRRALEEHIRQGLATRARRDARLAAAGLALILIAAVIVTTFSFGLPVSWRWAGLAAAVVIAAATIGGIFFDMKAASVFHVVYVKRLSAYEAQRQKEFELLATDTVEVHSMEDQSGS